MYKYTLTSAIGSKVVNPDTKNLKETYSKDSEKRSGYTRQLSGKLVFVGEDFDWLYLHEKSRDRCATIEILIEKKCSGSYVNYFNGRLNMSKGDWDLDVCKVSLEVETVDKYTCIDDNADVEIDLLQTVFSRVTAKLTPGILETATCTVGLDCPVTGDSWTWFKREYTINESMEEVGTDYYARYQVDVGIYEPAQLYNFRRVEFSENSGYYGYDVVGQTIDEIDNGIPFAQALEEMVANICPTLTVVSDFFQINPENVSTVNYVTKQQSKVLNLCLFQKSDVKRPNDANNASKAVITFEKLMSALYTFFQVKYYVEGNSLRIEHVSYEEGIDGIDFTAAKYKDFMFHKNKYSYARDKMPKFERFKAMEARYRDFVGEPIYYTGSCVIQSGSGSEKIYEAGDFTTDVLHVLDNPSSNSEVVADAGFVLMALSDDNRVLSEDGILTTSKMVNNTLAFAQLHRDYWRHNRVLNMGFMNAEEQIFFSALRTKKQVRISVPLCCSDVFDPNHLFKTGLGKGEVDRAEIDMATEILELDLLHEGLSAYLIDCPTMDMDSTIDTIFYSFASDVLATNYKVELVKDGTVIFTHDYAAPFAPSIEGTFSGLQIDKAHYVRVTLINEENEYERTCPDEIIYTAGIPCPAMSIVESMEKIILSISEIYTPLDEIEVKLFQAGSLIASQVFASEESLLVEFLDLTPNLNYTISVILKKGTYARTCDFPTTVYVSPMYYKYRLALSSTSSPCGVPFGNYYGVAPTFGVGVIVYLDRTLRRPALGNIRAVEEDTGTIFVMDETNAQIIENTGINC